MDETSYTCGYLTGVSHNGFKFDFEFDEFGRSKSIGVSGDGGDSESTVPLITMNYNKVGVNDINEIVYASEEKNITESDIFGNIIESTYVDKNGNSNIVSAATYDSSGKVKTLVDNERGVCYNCSYDVKGNVTRIVETDLSSGTVLATNSFAFDDSERLVSKTYGAIGHVYKPIYEKDANGYIYPDNEVVGIELDGKYTESVTKDTLRRASFKSFKVCDTPLFAENYTYLTSNRASDVIETEIVSEVISSVYGIDRENDSYTYTYDKAGNLETVSKNGDLVYKYYYDGLNRIRREDNHVESETCVWDYDEGGNILFKKVYALCSDIRLGTCFENKTYVYKSIGWRDQLISYNGLECVYDVMGNPTTYLGNTLTWTKVRRLASFGSNTFSYGANGIRYRKNNTIYTLDGNKILRESDGTKTLTYYYGGSGIVGFEYNGTDYYFRKNLQGDVTEIYTSDGERVASYVYDAWGKVLAVNNYTDDFIGNLNPIRYRSYYYDVETGLYYLNSRYYDPEVGRFINADTTDVLENAQYDINGLNLYAYCDNNPVTGRDDEGDMSFWKKLAVAVAVVAVVAVVAAATAATGGALCAAATVLVGAAKGAVIGAATGAAIGAATGAVQGAVEGYQETGTLDGTLRAMGKGAMKGAVEGAKDGFVSGLMMGGISTGVTTIANGHGTFCFVAGTTVLTTLGKKAIETIEIGDTVPCVDHITGEFSEKKVVTTTVNKVNRLIELDIDEEFIQCTETHPFQVKSRGWVNASDLNPGDIVYTKDWNTATVKSVNLLELDEPVEVFNFEVEDCHTYFVGNNCVLVHNLGCTQTNTSGVGQKHHPFSRKIVKAANNNPNLRGQVTRNSGTLKALTQDAHRGYQSWHRNFDNATVSWLNKHQSASLSEFTDFMNRLYGSNAATSRFGMVFFG